jgi:serine/threonine protein kinase
MPVQKLFNMKNIMKKLVNIFLHCIHLKIIFFLDIWSLGCVLYHMVALIPPFYTSNILLLASKICSSDYDQSPLRFYSDRIQQIVIQCLTVDPLNRPDIYGITQLCTEQLMLYTDRSCTTIRVLEKRLRQQDHQRELYFLKQQSQLQQQSVYHQRCLSCSSNNGIADVSFDGTDAQTDILKQEVFPMRMLRIILPMFTQFTSFY